MVQRLTADEFLFALPLHSPSHLSLSLTLYTSLSHTVYLSLSLSLLFPPFSVTIRCFPRAHLQHRKNRRKLGLYQKKNRLDVLNSDIGKQIFPFFFFSFRRFLATLFFCYTFSSHSLSSVEERRSSSSFAAQRYAVIESPALISNSSPFRTSIQQHLTP